MFKTFFPPHIYQNSCVYFITAHTFNHNSILITTAHKEIFFKVLSESCKLFYIELLGWTINLDHYHILIYLSKETNLKKFMQHLHGKSSFLLNRYDDIRGRTVWVNYWDRCIRSEKDFYTRLNYIHHNAVKHGYVKKMEDYNWSSCQFYLKKYGRDWLEDCFRRFSIKDFCIEGPD